MKLLLDMIKKNTGNELNEITDAEIWSIADDEIKFQAFVSDHGDFLTEYRQDLEAGKIPIHKHKASRLRSGLIGLLDWTNLSMTAKMDVPFIERYTNFIDWDLLSANRYTVTMDLYEKFKDKMDVNLVATAIPLSEEFLEKYSGSIRPYTIYNYQEVSEAFIERNINNALIYLIGRTQKLSLRFVKKYEDQFNWTEMSKNKHLSKDIIDEYGEQMDWNELVRTGVPSFEQVMKHIDKVDLDLCLERMGHKLKSEQRKELKEIMKMRDTFQIS